MYDRALLTTNKKMSEIKIVLDLPQSAQVRSSNKAGKCIRTNTDNGYGNLTPYNDNRKYPDPSVYSKPQ